MRKILCTVVTVILLLMIICMPVGALSRNYSYTYDSYNEPTTVSNPYYVKKTIGFELGLDAPKDIKIYNGELYILDSGNNRIVV